MADQSTQHTDDSHAAEIKKSRVSSQAAFWFMLIVAGLFIASLNFVEVMQEHHGEHGTEAHGVEPAAEHHAEQALPAESPVDFRRAGGDTTH